MRFPKRLVCPDYIGQLILRIDGKGHRDSTILCEFIGRIPQIVERFNVALICKERVAVFIPQFLRLVSNQRAFTAA